MGTLFRKEINGFFSSLTGYVVIVLFLLANAAFTWLLKNPMNIIERSYASLDGLFSLAPWVFLFLVPAITMRMIAEEKRTGTLDLLYTRPVSEFQIVFAKFLASWVLVLLSLLPTLIWVWSVYRLGSPVGNIDLAGTWGSYLGLIFLGGIYAAIGIFASSLSGNQIVAFLLAVLLSFVMFQGFAFMGDSAGSGKLALGISKLGIAWHYESMSRGVLDSRDILYFLVVCALFLLASTLGLQKRNWGRRHLRGTVLVVAVAALVLALSGLKFFRVDLTAEKRYTLAKSSREALRDLDEVVFARIYMDGEMPAEFVHFQKQVKDLMEECRAYAGDRLRYEFINLYEESDEELRNRMIGELYDQGLRVTSVQMKDREGGSSSRILFPGAMLSYGGYTLPVNFLKNNPALSHEQNLNHSIQSLEYEFMRAIHSLSVEEVPRIAFVEGHGELDSLQTHSLMNELKNFFQVDRGQINGNLDALLDYQALIIARPVRPYSEADKFALDQYLMHGGNLLFFLDPVNPFADSLSGGTTVALARQVGLEDLLFKYGIRVNYNLLADLQCSAVPVNMASTGEQARFSLMPWVYHPLLAGPASHPVTRGLNVVKGEFSSVLDTVDVSGELRRTVLLASSSASRKREVPLYLSMEEVTQQPDPALYNQSGLPVAILSEGVFPSFYKNYPVPPGVQTARAEVLPESRHTSLLVVADGDIPANGVSFEQGAYRAQPLGYDRYTRQTFGNLEFIMNAVNMMCDDRGLMELRSRDFSLRLLNQEVISQPARVRKWKLFNSLLPIAVVILAGGAVNLWRKRKYSR
jgi:ABC-2 type transport system permease protein